VNVVDSSAWLEYFGDGPNAQFFAEAIEKTGELVVPSLTLFGVFKLTLQLADETTALNAVAVIMQGGVVDLSASLSIESARLSSETGLAMADAVILATARSERAVLWTQDSHFAGLPGVEYPDKQRSGATG
jgi:predicted nucleic acid-binding protein